MPHPPLIVQSRAANSFALLILCAGFHRNAAVWLSQWNTAKTLRCFLCNRYSWQQRPHNDTPPAMNNLNVHNFLFKIFIFFVKSNKRKKIRTTVRQNFPSLIKERTLNSPYMKASEGDFISRPGNYHQPNTLSTLSICLWLVFALSPFKSLGVNSQHNNFSAL